MRFFNLFDCGFHLFGFRIGLFRRSRPPQITSTSSSNSTSKMASASELVAAVRGWAACVNEKRWDDLPKYMCPTYNQNGVDYTPESWAARVREHVATELGGDIRINEDSILVDEESQCVALSMWFQFQPKKPFLGFEPAGRDVWLVQHGFLWFSQGKLSKALFVVNSDHMRGQLSSPSGEHHVPDLISEYPVPKAEAPLSRAQLADVYRAYVDTVNERRTKEDYAKYVNSPEAVLNNRALARAIVENTLEAIPDLHVDIHTLIADEASQRLAVWLEFSGTPIIDYAGLLAGNAVKFNEHATYQFVGGKIQRIWGVMDLDAARRQQQTPPKEPLMLGL